MFTAKEAREHTQKSLDDSKSKRLLEERKRVESGITEAIKKGNNFCILDGFIHTETVAWLKSMGYDVTCKTDWRDHSRVVIDW